MNEAAGDAFLINLVRFHRN